MPLAQLTRRLHDAVLRSFGRRPEDRKKLVRTMLEPRDGDATGYWLQLAIATMLATLGLALDSTAVVIGAMLIAPLMRPLVELAMGLATGSAALALRALVRTLASVALVSLVAFAITWLLPFHAITRELEARTAPTLLDLVVAGGCALAAAYATLRADADIVTTAAGTSIGISLVPPLGAVGYGIALGDFTAARGAALLFTANLTGILAVATAVFVLAGFGHIDGAALAEETVVRGRAAKLGHAYSRIASARLGPASRIIPPLLLVGAVFLPLSRALGEIKHRQDISRDLADLLHDPAHRIVEYTLDQSANAVVVRVVVVGGARDATALDAEIRRHLAALAVDTPHVSVWAVPDAQTMSALSRRIDEIPPPVEPEPAPTVVRRYAGDLVAVMRATWPPSAGGLVRVWLDVEHPDHLHVVHLGAPLGPAANELLARALEPIAGRLVIDEDALPPVDAAAEAGTAWLPQATDLLARARKLGSLHVCVTLVPPPPPPTSRRAPPSDIPRIRDAITAAIAGASDVTVADGEHWRAEATLDACPSDAAR